MLLHLAIGAYLEGDYPRAVQLAKRTTRAGPGEPAVYRWLVAALGQLGNIEEAAAVIQEVTSLLAPVPFDSYAVAQGPWLRHPDLAALLDGLHKAGWQPTRAA